MLYGRKHIADGLTALNVPDALISLMKINKPQ